MTAKEWRDNNPNFEGNIMDYVDILRLIILSNLEALNASMLDNNVNQSERLNITARKELSILMNDKNVMGIQNIVKEMDNKLIEIK